MRKEQSIRVMAASVTLLLAACSSTTFDPESKVESVRIIATQADKPYALPGDMVTIRVLAVDQRPTQPHPMEVFWFPNPCIDPANDGYFNCYPALLKQYPVNTDLTAQLQTGDSASFQMPPDVIVGHQGPRGDVPYGVMVVFLMACAGHVEAVSPPPGSGPDALPFGCFDSAHNPMTADDYVFGYQVLFAFTGRTNANPVIDHLEFAGAAVDANAGITVAHCTAAAIDSCPTLPLSTVVPDSSQELNPGNVDVNGKVLKEEIWADYLVTGGKVKNDVQVLFDPRLGRLAGVTNQFYAPQAPGDYTLWSVVRDDRGGAAWLSIPVHAK
jgi:hypothetical protein